VLQKFSTANHPDQQHDDSNHQEDVDMASYGIGADHSQQPKRDEDHTYYE